MTEVEARLLSLLKERSFKLGDFRLASGDPSSYYIDGKMTEVCSEGAHLIGEVLYQHTCELGIDAIGGLEVGAVPLTTATVISYYHHGKHIEGFWVRVNPKVHGTKKPIEGKLEPGSRVVLVDDVVTRGTSVLKAVRAVEEINCKIVCVLALVDRLRGAAELFAGEGIEFRSVFTIHDLGVTPDVPSQVGAAAR